MDSTTALVTYSVTEAEIAQTREACLSLTCDTPAGYEAVRVAIGNLRTTRGAIEKRRVELKADALAFGRLVDTEAKRFTGLILEIEDPLKAKKAVVDDEADRVKREKELVAALALQAEIDRKAAEKVAAEKAIRDAEAARLAEERAALAVERAEYEAQQKRDQEKAKADLAAYWAGVEATQRVQAEERERADAERAVREAAAHAERARIALEQKAEQDRLNAERRALEAERVKAERAEFERQAKIQAEKDAAAKIEQDRIDEARRKAELAALAPDIEKVNELVAVIRAIAAPKCKSKKVAELVAETIVALGHVADALTTNMAAVKGRT